MQDGGGAVEVRQTSYARVREYAMCVCENKHAAFALHIVCTSHTKRYFRTQ